MLRRLGQRIPHHRIQESLAHIDPVHRVFDQIRIHWHIQWGIVIHGFIDGYSRLITGLRASDNNGAQTVLDLFLHATRQYGVPSRVRGDHGTENLYVAAFMDTFRDDRQRPYIWGR